MPSNEDKPASEFARTQTNPVEQPTLMARIGSYFSRWRSSDVTETGQMDTNKLAESRTNLAASRTLMAADRTLMAWVRTALSMISFGFTIYKVLEGLQQSGSEVAARASLAVKTSPENVGLFLIGLGTVSMVMGTLEYWHNIKELRKIQHFRILRPAFVMALIISITGLATFVSVIAKIL